MSSKLTTNEILTEHFGYQPISVVDDVINVVNDIMYKSTGEIDKVLLKRRNKIQNDHKEKLEAKRRQEDESDVIVSEDEDDDEAADISYTEQDVKKGTAKLESLLEHLINKNYDKFEVYTMRNIMTIPEELVTGGYVRLKHQEGLTIDDNTLAESQKVEDEYTRKLNEVSRLIERNKRAAVDMVKIVRLSRFTKKLRSKMAAMDYNGSLMQKKRGNVGHIAPKATAEDQMGPKLVNQYDLKPLGDTYKFINNQIKGAYTRLEDNKQDMRNDKLVNAINRQTPAMASVNKRVREMINNGQGIKPDGEKMPLDILEKLGNILGTSTTS